MAAGQGYIEFTTGDILTASAANGYLASQVVMVFADAAARTSAVTSPQEGMMSYLKDTNSVEYYSGSAWVAVGGGGGGGSWAAWTPTYSGITIGNGTVTARYLETSGTIFFEWLFTFGSTSAFTGYNTFTLPANIKGATGGFYAKILDAGVQFRPGEVSIDGAATLGLQWINSSISSGVSATSPFTWASGDGFYVRGFYEKA